MEEMEAGLDGGGQEQTEEAEWRLLAAAADSKGPGRKCHQRPHPSAKPPPGTLHKQQHTKLNWN